MKKRKSQSELILSECSDKQLEKGTNSHNNWCALFVTLQPPEICKIKKRRELNETVHTLLLTARK